MLKLKIMVALLLTSMCLFSTAKVFSFYLPPGNYSQTCNFCRMTDSNKLKCVCLTAQQFPMKTSLYVDPRCSFVENINGNLQCTHYDRHIWHKYRGEKLNIAVGHLWNQNEANRKCPSACGSVNSDWTGSWNVNGAGGGMCQCVSRGF